MSFYCSIVLCLSNIRLLIFGTEVFAFWNIKRLNREEINDYHADGYEYDMRINPDHRILA